MSVITTMMRRRRTADVPTVMPSTREDLLSVSGEAFDTCACGGRKRYTI